MSKNECGYCFFSHLSGRRSRQVSTLAFAHIAATRQFPRHRDCAELLCREVGVLPYRLLEAGPGILTLYVPVLERVFSESVVLSHPEFFLRRSPEIKNASIRPRGGAYVPLDLSIGLVTASLVTLKLLIFCQLQKYPMLFCARYCIFSNLRNLNKTI